MADLVACPSCRRHFDAEEDACPFCGHTDTVMPVPVEASEEMQMAVYGGPPEPDGPVMMPMYGAPPDQLRQAEPMPTPRVSVKAGLTVAAVVAAIGLVLWWLGLM